MPDEIAIPPVAPELEGPDVDLIEETIQFVKVRAETVSQAKIEIGEFLFEKYGNSDESHFRNGIFYPYKEKSYLALIADDDWPFKETAVRNMIHCAVQAKWFRSERIRTAHLGYTHQVLLTRLPDDDRKKQLIRRIKKEEMTVRQLDMEISRIKLSAQLGLTRSSRQLPDTFNEVVGDYENWLNPFLEENFIRDLFRAKNNDPAEPLTLGRRKDMRKIIDGIVEKFEKTIEMLLAAKSTLNKPKKPRQLQAPQTPIENDSVEPQDDEEEETVEAPSP